MKKIIVFILMTSLFVCKVNSYGQNSKKSGRIHESSQKTEELMQDFRRAKEIIRQLQINKKINDKDLDFLETFLLNLESNQIKLNEELLSPIESGNNKLNLSPGKAIPILNADGKFIIYIADLKENPIWFFWKDGRNRKIRTISKLNKYLDNAGYDLLFAINGGIYEQYCIPKGLYIENGKILNKLDTKNPGDNFGNFYLLPNGLFVIDANRNKESSIKYALQSGPMLIDDGVINEKFSEKSRNIKIRTGVGIISKSKVVFAISQTQVSFYQFAQLFKSLGCNNALYLDGGPAVSVYIARSNVFQGHSVELAAIIGVAKKSSAHKR